MLTINCKCEPDGGVRIINDMSSKPVCFAPVVVGDGGWWFIVLEVHHQLLLSTDVEL